MPLTAEDILRAFEALADELSRRNERAQIAIAGGAALVLLFNARESTRDVDAYIVSPTASVVRDAVAEVATTLELPPDWLNDAAKGYFVGLSLGAPLYDSPSLAIRAVTTAQLLAMKLAAWRDAVDRADARLLLTSVEGTREQIWDIVRRYVPPHDLQKASYAFDDLWEALNGSP
ncbi:MAG: DUF6036 family nucleotidyltransferase [Vicinamibacterales bacterium]